MRERSRGTRGNEKGKARGLGDWEESDRDQAKLGPSMG